MHFLSRKAWEKVPRDLITKKLKSKLVKTKWVFRKKIEQDQTIHYKSRGVTIYLMQIPGIAYRESFTPVASDTATRLMIGMYL
jgi:hypothetical protein